jgi:hypothetical protein
MTIYQITEEQCQVTKPTSKFTSAEKKKEALYALVVANDRNPEKIYRSSSLEEAKEQFAKIKASIGVNEVNEMAGMIGDYNGFTTASFTVFELVEWEVNEDGDIIEGGDVWDWFMV